LAFIVAMTQIIFVSPYIQLSGVLQL